MYINQEVHRTVSSGRKALYRPAYFYLTIQLPTKLEHRKFGITNVNTKKIRSYVLKKYNFIYLITIFVSSESFTGALHCGHVCFCAVQLLQQRMHETCPQRAAWRSDESSLQTTHIRCLLVVDSSLSLLPGGRGRVSWLILAKKSGDFAPGAGFPP